MSDVAVWVLGSLGAFALITVIWWFVYGRTNLRTRVSLDRWKMHAPLLGKMLQTDVTHQMLNIIYAYLSVGGSEREALIDTAGAVSNRAVARHLRSTADGLLRGEKTFAEFLDDDMFPPLARQILGAGQRAGQTLETLKSLERTYSREAEVEAQQGIARVVNLVTGISSMIFVVVVTMVTVPPLEMFGSTLSYDGVGNGGS